MTAAAIRTHSLPIKAWGFSADDPNDRRGRSGFKRILLAVTDSQSSARAVVFVADLVRDSGTEVFVVHFNERVSVGRGAYWDLETIEESAALMRQVAAELQTRGVFAETWTDRSVSDFTARGVALAARACAADVVVIGSPRGRSPIWASVRGSVSHALLHALSIPVVVVP